MKKILLPLLSIFLFLTILANFYIDLFPKKGYSLNYVEAVQIEKKDESLIEPSLFDKKVEKVNWKQIQATSIYAFNPISGQTYFAKNIYDQRPIASITKLMTILVAYDQYGMDTKIEIDKPLPVMDRSLGLKIGDEIMSSELFQASLVSSQNDSANALAIMHPEGYEHFISLMNEKAKVLGMRNTNFSNPTGFINTNNYSTAYDLGILSSVFINNSDLVSITSRKSENIKILGTNKRKIDVFATNILLNQHKYVKGLKTGFTYQSGECLVTYFKANEQDQLVTIVLNSPSRFNETSLLYQLINEAFD